MAAKDEMSTSQWVQFFRAAGLPQQVSVQYAVVFADNRIQWGMLMDLTKEYLFDMGIHTMGDVIAILKHAKHVHSQEAQEKLMRSAPSSGTKLAVGIPSRYMPAKALERAPVVAETPPVSRVSFQRDYEQPAEPRATVRPLSKRRMADEEPVAAQVAPKRLGIGSPASHRVVPQQPAAVSPHKEGPTLKVVLPSGATARTRQLLGTASQPPGVSAGTQVAGKRSVFDRLGESTVSSTTDSSLVSSSKGTSTVFQRLGPSTGSEEKVEPARTVLPTTRRQQLPQPYQAVLAAAAKPSRVIRLNTPSTAARAVARRQVLPPSSSARASARGGGDSEGGGVMLRRSLTEAASARLGLAPGRLAARAAGAAPAVASQRLGSARDRLGPKVAVATAGTVRRTTVRTTVPTSAAVAARKGVTVVPTSKRAVLLSQRAGFSESSAAPQNVFSRLGGKHKRSLIL
ncbi:uncharacterized protein LOC144132576 isoform X2 [Amblyomma americanum]